MMRKDAVLKKDLKKKRNLNNKTINEIATLN